MCHHCHTIVESNPSLKVLKAELNAAYKIAKQNEAEKPEVLETDFYLKLKAYHRYLDLKDAVEVIQGKVCELRTALYWERYAVAHPFRKSQPKAVKGKKEVSLTEQQRRAWKAEKNRGKGFQGSRDHDWYTRNTGRVIREKLETQEYLAELKEVSRVAEVIELFPNRSDEEQSQAA